MSDVLSRPTRASDDARLVERAAARSIARRQSRSVPPSDASAASRTFSSTVSSGNTLDTWNVRPSPSRVRRNVGWSRDVAARAARSVPAVGR